MMMKNFKLKDKIRVLKSLLKSEISKNKFELQRQKDIWLIFSEKLLSQVNSELIWAQFRSLQPGFVCFNMPSEDWVFTGEVIEINNGCKYIGETNSKG